MSIKKSIMKLEKEFKIKFPELNVSFYVSRRNMCVHMRLDKTIFAYSNFKQIIVEIKKFFDNHLAGKFAASYPQLIHSAKWEFDYIVAKKKEMSKKSWQSFRTNVRSKRLTMASARWSNDLV